MRVSKFTHEEREHYARLACEDTNVNVAGPIGVHWGTIIYWKREFGFTVPNSERRVTAAPRIDRDESQLVRSIGPRVQVTYGATGDALIIVVGCFLIVGPLPVAFDHHHVESPVICAVCLAWVSS